MTKRKTPVKKPVTKRQVAAAKKSMPKPKVAPVQQPQQPVMSNEQYMINVMTERCKSLEMKVIKLAKELAILKSKEAKDAD